MGGTFDELAAQSDALLQGRPTYQVSASAWPTRSGDPFSDGINRVQKYVVSNTLSDTSTLRPRWKKPKSPCRGYARFTTRWVALMRGDVGGTKLFHRGLPATRIQEDGHLLRAEPQCGGERAMAYLLDANVFIAAKNLRYGLDFCPAFWDWLIREHEAGKVFTIEKVADELQAGDDERAKWAESLPDSVLGRMYQYLLGQFAGATNSEQP